MDKPDMRTAVGLSLPAAGAPPRGFALQLSERKLLLGVMDLLAVNAALILTREWQLGAIGWRTTAGRPSWYVVLTALWLVVSFLLDAYNLRRAARLASGTTMGAAAALTTALLYLAIPYLTPPLPTSRWTLFVFVGVTVAAVSAWRAAYALVLVKPALRRKALVVGAGSAGRTIVQAVRAHAPAEYDLVGFIDDDPAKEETTVDGLPVLGSHTALLQAIAQTGASEVIVAITYTDLMDAEMFQAIMDCHEAGVHVAQMAALYEQLTGRVAVEHAGRNFYVVLPLTTQPTRLYRIVKRLMDLAISSAGCVATMLLLPIVAIATWLEDRGPVFYRQVRLGQGGRHLTLLKFRTMVADAERAGPQWAQETDQRVTRVGRILRRFHLDEVPQAIDLLRGSLSFVGPRPERPEFVTQLERAIPFYRARHAVKPGITGWAQVNYRYGASVEDALIKLQYDLYYVKNQSLSLDLAIIIRTIGLVLTMRGSR